jgi:hypothetical protein
MIREQESRKIEDYLARNPRGKTWAITGNSST